MNEVIPPRVFFEQSRDGIHILDTNGKLRGQIASSKRCSAIHIMS